MNQGWDIRKEDPLVSVCVVTYNHASYIQECLDGALNQNTDFPYEICVGEDDSSDGTREICQAYAEKYPDKIRLFLRSREDVIFINGRATGRYNFLETLKSCRGKYIARCEGDDFWTDSGKLAKQVGFMEANPDYSLCCSNVMIHNESEKLGHYFGYSENPFNRNNPGVLCVPKNDVDRVSFTLGNRLHTPGILYRNSFTEEQLSDPLFKISFMADWPMNILALEHGPGKFMKEPMAVYRMHGGGIWSNSGEQERLENTIRSAVAMVESPLFFSETKEGLKKGIAHFLINLRYLKSPGGSYPVENLLVDVCGKQPECKMEIMGQIRTFDKNKYRSLKNAVSQAMKYLGMKGKI